MDGLISGPVDIFKLGPFWSGTERPRIRSALVRIPVKERIVNSNLNLSFYEHLAKNDFLSDNLPGACKVCQIEYHALGERYLGPSIIFRPMGQTSDQGRSEKIWQLLPVDASWPLK